MANPSIYRRKISQNEKAYIFVNRCFYPSTLQLIVEGVGDIRPDVLQNAVDQASIACPGSRVTQKGAFWIGNRTTPKVSLASNNQFDGYNFEALDDVFNKKLTPESENNIEIVILRKQPYSVLFRIFHGVMDAKGAMLWIENIFKSLRNEPLLEAKSTLTDFEFAQKQGGKRDGIRVRFDCRLTLDRPKNNGNQIYWKRLTLPNHHIGLVPKLAKILSAHFAEHKTRYIIPVDLRKHDKAVQSTGNLLMPIYLESEESDGWREIYKDLAGRIRREEELNLSNATYGIISKLPYFLIKFFANLFVNHSKRKQTFLNTGIISNVGKISLNKFSTASFRASALYFLPTHHPLAPLSIASTEYPGCTEIIISSVEDVISKKTADEILRAIPLKLKHLSPSSPAFSMQPKRIGKVVPCKI